ncbi:MAG: PhoH family protein [Candidatus Neomarinimicrobiota bacterium]|nr:PhoH family protein [Candidatus Neomarinimicrobiota bacterium]
MEKILEIKTIEPATLLGVGDAHLKLIQEALPAILVVRGDVIKISGEKTIVEQVHEVLHEMMTTLGSKGNLSSWDVQKLIALVQSTNGYEETALIPPDRVIHYGQKGAIVPKTTGQDRYADLVVKNDIVFAMGPAGTGKTFLAIAFAVAALDRHEADRIVLCRPAVEAGESLGFLPGDLKEKVDPYFAPIYDALNYMLPQNRLRKLLENKTIEVAPLAYMRGRTLDNAFMILDEAQNAAIMQMKMFLTRLGNGSRAIVTGDMTQIDLQRKTDSGLVQVVKILQNVDGIGFVTLDDADVVRHPLVRKIILAYDSHEPNKKK